MRAQSRIEGAGKEDNCEWDCRLHDSLTGVSNLRSAWGSGTVWSWREGFSLTPVSPVKPQKQQLLGSRGWRSQWEGGRGRKILGYLLLRNLGQAEQGTFALSVCLFRDHCGHKICSWAKLWGQHFSLVFTDFPVWFSSSLVASPLHPPSVSLCSTLSS